MRYVPNTQEKDPQKVILSLQQAHQQGQANADDITTNTANIANRAVGPASSTDNAAARFDGTTGKLLQDSSLLVADSTGALSRSGNGGIPVQGTNTNDNAAAGNVGEYTESALTSAAPVSLTNDTAANIVSISLTAGDWDITGAAGFTGGATTTVNYMRGSISASSGVLGGENARSVFTPNGATIFATTSAVTFPLVTLRASLASTTTYYLVSQAGFGVSTMSGFGVIRARRVR